LAEAPQSVHDQEGPQFEAEASHSDNASASASETYRPGGADESGSDSGSDELVADRREQGQTATALLASYNFVPILKKGKRTCFFDLECVLG
jgi:hypothetical protein